MIYIKNDNNRITLGGQVATAEMLASGWFAYSGEIPAVNYGAHEYFALEDGVLVVKTDNAQFTESKIAELKKYLADTDYKMTVDYYATLTPDQQAELTKKRDEARKLIREYQSQVNNQLTA